jgi:hypothetical protein
MSSTTKRDLRARGLNTRLAAGVSAGIGIAVIASVVGLLNHVDRTSIPDPATAQALACFLFVIGALGVAAVAIAVWLLVMAQEILFDVDELDEGGLITDAH